MNETEGNAPNGADFTAMMDELLSIAGDMGRKAEERYADLLPRLVVSLTGDDAQVPEALASGRLMLDGFTFALRLNAQSGQLEFFCDVGVPASHSREEVFRKCLEFNLCRTVPGIALGAHPDSGRVVATSSLHMMMVNDESVCVQMIETLRGLVQELRSSGELALEE